MIDILLAFWSVFWKVALVFIAWSAIKYIFKRKKATDEKA